MKHSRDHTRRGEIDIPLVTAAVPAFLFRLQGVLVAGWGKPGLKLPLSVTVPLIVLEVLGIVAMAVVALWRLELGSRKLIQLAAGKPQFWRKCFLVLSISCLVLFDVVTNTVAAFGGAGSLLPLAALAFISYVICNRVAIRGLAPP